MKLLAFLLLFISLSVHAKGSFHLFFKGLSTQELPHKRDIYVYLPHGYESSQDRYPVLYMHDGQNLFDPQRAYLGQTWKALQTLDELIARKEIPPVIVVAIDNTPARMDEYIPEKKGSAYLRLITDLVKPLVERSFRVKKGPRYTGLMGSSLGGLISLQAGISHPHAFGLIGALSPSIWWNNRSILMRYDRASTLPIRIYLDSGTIGGEKPEDVEMLSHQLSRRGLTAGRDFTQITQEGADHREHFWAQRFPLALRFLFSPSRLK